MATLGEHLKIAEADIARAMNEIVGDRDEAWRRVSAMAGVDEHGCILPPAAGASIARPASLPWKTNYGAR